MTDRHRHAGRVTKAFRMPSITLRSTDDAVADALTPPGAASKIAEAVNAAARQVGNKYTTAFADTFAETALTAQMASWGTTPQAVVRRDRVWAEVARRTVDGAERDPGMTRAQACRYVGRELNDGCW